MSLPTSLIPVVRGVYGDWARSGPTVGPGVFAAHWLGDVTKENDFLADCVAYGWNYIPIYNLNTLDSGSNFTAPAIAMLRAFISKAHDTYGVAIGGVRNIFGGDDLINGTSEMQCIINYNAAVNPNERFDFGNIENEPWNFPNNPTSPGGTVSAVGTTVTGVGTTFTTSTAVKRFIKVAGQYRQVIAIANNLSLTIDRPFSPAIPAGSTWQDYNTVTNGTSRFNFTVDYDTYIYRAGLCSNLLFAAGIQLELYISRNSANSFLQQLASICPATRGRIALTQFQVTPNYNYDRNAAIQICSAGIPVRGLFLCSVESTTFYAGCDDPADCVGTPDTNSNFLGFWHAGRNSAGTLLYAPKDWQDLWNYLVKTAPYTNTPTPSNLGTGANPSANEETDALVIANMTWEGILYFKQGILRQLAIAPPSPLTAAITVQDDVTCNGAANGALTAAAGGGTGPYDFHWTGPGGYTHNDLAAASSAITGLQPGLYNLTVNDSAAGSVVITGILISEPSIITCSGNTNPVICNGGSTGSITSVTPSGGDGSYSYSWADGPVTANRTGLSAGVYVLTVTDGNGCTGIFPFTITEPAAITVPIVQTDPTCFPSTNGQLTANPAGGSGTYVSYAWTGPGGYVGSGQVISGLNTPGVYTVVVTDSNGCTGTNNATLVRPTDITQAAVITPPTVYGGNDGSIILNPSGGPSGVYTFEWTGPGGFTSTNQDLTNPPDLVVEGNYHVKITDGTCIREFDLVVPPGTTPLTAIVDSTTNPVCFGVDSGAITAHAINGTAPYDFAWTGPGGYAHTDVGVLSSTISGLAPGTYHLVVTDAVAATASPTDPVLTQNPVISDSGTQQDCTSYGANDGFIHPVLGGGSGTYPIHTWTGPGGYTATTLNIDNLVPGNYTLSVTDSAGCLQTFPFTIAEGPAAPLSVTPVVTDIICNGSATGSINPHAGGGSGNYGYSWSGPGGYGSTAAVISGLVAGIYTLTLVDLTLGGAPLVTPITVSESSDINIVATPIYNNSPCGPFSKDLSVAVSGGPAGTFTVELYEATSGLVGTGLLYTGLPAGNYTVKVRKQWGPGLREFCFKQITFPIYSCLNVTGRTQDVACKGGQVGSVQLFVTGGSGTVTYLWNTGDTTNSIINQFAGVYTCDVTDTVTGEVKPVSFVISEPYVQLAASVAPNNPTSPGAADGWIQALPVGGFGAWTYQWDDPLGQTTQIASGLRAGTYNCIITDSGKCSVTVAATITDPPSTVLVPPDDLTKYVTDFAIKKDNIKCCIGMLTEKLADAIRTGDSKCIFCYELKLSVLNMIYSALGDWSYSRVVTPAVPASSGGLDMADNPAINVPTYAQWTLEVNGNAIVVIEGFYPTLYATILANMIAAINSDGRFVASNILPAIGFKITDNLNQGAFLNGKTVDLTQRYTSLVIDPVLTQGTGDPPGTCFNIAYDTVRKLTYVPDAVNNQVYVYDINDALVATIIVGDTPGAIVYHPANDLIYVFCPGDSTCHTLRNLSNLGNFAISALMQDSGHAVYDPSTQKIVVSEMHSAGSPTHLFVYNAANAETTIPLVTNVAHVIFYNPNLFRVICLPKNAAQPQQLNTFTNVLSAFAMVYPLGTISVVNGIYVQDGSVDNMFISTSGGLLRYLFGGSFVSSEASMNSMLGMIYNSPSKLIIGWGTGELTAYNPSTNTVVIPRNTFPTPGLTLAYHAISRGINSGKNTVVFCSTYFAGPGVNIAYVVEIQPIVSVLSETLTGGVDSYNTFTFDNCMPNEDYDALLRLAAEICCGEGCGCCE